MAKCFNSTFKNIVIVSSSTLISRILGYLRDAAIFASFGASVEGAAFLFAFSIPNMFRKLLGEGALSSALLPVLSAQCVRNGKQSMFNTFSYALYRLILIFLIILACSLGATFLAKTFVSEYKWELALTFTMTVLPYMVFICLAALVSAALNVMSKFFITSINQVWLNLSMITSVLIGRFIFHLEGTDLAYCLIAGVLIGGAIQLIIPFIAIIHHGWRPHINNDTAETHKNIRTAIKLFLPAALGAAIDELNVLISRSIAFNCCAAAVTLIYSANRIIDIPSGILGASILSVFFPKFIHKMLKPCMEAMLWTLVPAAIGIFVMKHEIVSILYGYGKFQEENVSTIFPIISIYCINMVFTGLSSMFVRWFHSMKDIKTPVRVGMISAMTNITLSLIFVNIFKQDHYKIIGLVSANTCASLLQVLILFKIASNDTIVSDIIASHKVLFATAFGGILVFITATLSKYAAHMFLNFTNTKINDALALFIAIATSVPIYLLISKNLIKSAFSEYKSI